jgi:hypothetical protein
MYYHAMTMEELLSEAERHGDALAAELARRAGPMLADLHKELADVQRSLAVAEDQLYHASELITEIEDVLTANTVYRKAARDIRQAVAHSHFER